MSDMEIDSPSVSSSSSPSDGIIIQRLGKLGIPVDELDEVGPSIVAYFKDNNLQIEEMVSVILPIDKEVYETFQDVNSESKGNGVDPYLRDLFQESVGWLQWLMFEMDPHHALQELTQVDVNNRAVCGAVWGSNDIAYRCRTCQHDPTCAICVPCFQKGNHRDHDYSVIYTGGGCCDCGDVTAWKQEGFCSSHKGAEHIQPLSEKYAKSVGPVLDAILCCWRKKLLSDHAENKEIANALTSVIVEMLLEFCSSSESLLSFVAKGISSSPGLLDLLVRAERILVAGVVLKLHELLLKLLSEPVFKYEFAKTFLDYYPSVVNEVIKAKDDSVFKGYPLLSAFSVQILTVPTLTPRLVKERNLLGMLLGCVVDIFGSCAGEDGQIQVTTLGNLYEIIYRILEDVRFVLSHDIVSKYVTHEERDILITWMKILAFVQGANPLKRESGFHMEEENENATLPFYLGLIIAKIHLLLVDGALSISGVEEMNDETHLIAYKQELDDVDSLRHAKVGRISRESSACSSGGSSFSVCSAKEVQVKSGININQQIPSSFIWLTFECLKAIEDWLGADKNLLNTLSRNVNGMSSSNFSALRNKLSNIRKSNYILRLAGSSTAQGTKSSSLLSESHMSIDTDKGGSPGQSSGLMITNSDDTTDLSGFDGTNKVGGSAADFDSLRILGLSVWPDITYDVSSQDVSVHIPLHRLLSRLLRKALRKCYGESALSDADCSSSTHHLYWDFFGHVLPGCHSYGLSALLMEHPLRNRVFCAQVQAGMWRRNGDSALISCGWYRSVRWGGHDLELDLFLLQCCAALAPADLFVKRILERFGLSSYLSLNLERTSEYEPALVQEVLTLLIHIVKERRFCGLNTSESLKRELVHKLAIGDATHSQLVKDLPRDLSKVDQLQEILDSIAVYSNPSQMNQGMYSLRMLCWRELDLYHPLWNPRDLQVAEERYMRFCSISPLTTQLPKWTKIYDPLKGVARVATCKVVLEIIRSVIYYAVMTDKLTTSRAPDMVLLTSLHLLALALDVCVLQKHPGELSCYTGDAMSMLAFVGKEIGKDVSNRSSDQSLLSLLVSLMRLRKNEDLSDYMEAGHCNLSSFIGSLLRRFAEIDSECMAKLQRLAPEVVGQLIESLPKGNTNVTGSVSDAEKRKAKARERQAAIMANMKAQQSKFLVSVGSTSDGGLNSMSSDQEESKPANGHDSEDPVQDVCSLCHDPSSGSPVSYLILLQKSRLLTMVDRGPCSWEQVDQHGRSTSSGNSDTAVSSQLTQNVVNEFASHRQPPYMSRLLDFIRTHSGETADINAFLDFIGTHNPDVKSILEPRSSADRKEGTTCFFETWEEDAYFSILSRSNQIMAEDGKSFSEAELGANGNVEAEFLGKYIAAILKNSPKKASEYDDKVESEVIAHSAYDGFGPSDADGIHISSCEHAVHQGCLDRYLSSLKERYSRRISFEGGNIVDPDKGEFLCPVCRRLANCVLPALPGGLLKVWLSNPYVSLQRSAGCSPSSNEGYYSHYLHQAVSLMKSAGYVIRKDDKHKAFPVHKTVRISPNLESLFRVLCGMYFSGEQNEMSQSACGHPVILWDTLRYSLISMEFAARSGKTNLIPNYDLKALHEGLNSSNGFVLSLLLGLVQCLRSKNVIHVLERFKGLQLFEESICPDAFMDEYARRGSRCGDILRLSKDAETEVSSLGIRLHKRASDPVLSHDPFSSLIWVFFCLPYPFLTCEESFLCLVHLFYAVSVVQAIIAYWTKYQREVSEPGFHDCLIADISKVMKDVGVRQKYLISNYMDFSCDIKHTIRSLSFPYLRKCALLWKLVNPSTSAPLGDMAVVSDQLSGGIDAVMHNSCVLEALPIELVKLEKMFRIPSLDATLKDNLLRPLALKWIHDFYMDSDVHSPQSVLHLTPAVPFKLMDLPHIYQELLERFIKRRCPECEPALCLFCGRLCSASLKTCHRDVGCQTHAMACGAGTGVFLLIKKTTVLLQRSARRSPWPSPYLDAFGEEDIDMRRGKPLFLNEERYAALTQMVASHGLDQSSKVLGQTTVGSFIMI